MCRFPTIWLPDAVIQEGMFIVNTTPLNIHSQMSEYTTFLLTHCAGWYLNAGVP